MATPRGLSPLHILSSKVPGHPEVLSSRPALHPTCSVPSLGSWSPDSPQAAPAAPASTRAHRPHPPEDRVLLPASSGIQPTPGCPGSHCRGLHRTGDELHPRPARRNQGTSPAQPGSQLAGPLSSSLHGLSSFRTNTVAQRWYSLPPTVCGAESPRPPPTHWGGLLPLSCKPSAPLTGTLGVHLLSVEAGPAHIASLFLTRQLSL